MRIFHPAFGEVLNYSAVAVGDDPDEQVAATIDLMRRYVREDCQSPEIQAIAQSIRAEGGDPAQSLFARMKRDIRFVNDDELSSAFRTSPDSPIVEVLIRPVDLARLGLKAGDCDDWSMYCAAVLRCLGYRTAFVTVAADPRDPRAFSHVYVAAYQNGARIAMDTSHGKFAGWEVPDARITRKEEWDMDGGGLCWLLIPALAVAGYLGWKEWKRR